MIGSMRNKVTLLSRQSVEDGGGGRAVTWQPAEELWAAIEKLSPVRDFTGGTRRFLTRIAAEVRFDKTLEAGRRLRIDNADYEIVSVETVDERQRRLVLIAEEVRL